MRDEDAPQRLDPGPFEQLLAQRACVIDEQPFHDDRNARFASCEAREPEHDTGQSRGVANVADQVVQHDRRAARPVHHERRLALARTGHGGESNVRVPNIR